MISVRRLTVAGVLALAVLIGGCATGQQAGAPGTATPGGRTATPTRSSDSTPSAAPTASGTGVPSSPRPTMAPGDLEEEQFAAVRRYLEVRENAESVRYHDAAAWRAAIRRTTTSDGAPRVIKRFGPARTSPAQHAASQNRYLVEPMVGSCTTNPALPATDTRVAVVCELVDLVTAKDGTVVPPDRVDPRWRYVGDRTAPMLTLTKSGGDWLVDADYTGQAS